MGFVVVHHPDCLHEGVHDRATDEAESALLKVFAQGVGLGGGRWNLLDGFPGINDWLPADELPYVTVEAAEFALDFEEGACIVHCRRHLEAIANKAFVLEQFGDLAGVVLGDFSRVEVVESAAVIFALLQDGVPTQARLRAFENEELKKRSVIVDGAAPLFVVVANSKFVLGPEAAPFQVIHHRDIQI